MLLNLEFIEKINELRLVVANVVNVLSFLAPHVADEWLQYLNRFKILLDLSIQHHAKAKKISLSKLETGCGLQIA